MIATVSALMLVSPVNSSCAFLSGNRPITGSGDAGSDRSGTAARGAPALASSQRAERLRISASSAACGGDGVARRPARAGIGPAAEARRLEADQRRDQERDERGRPPAASPSAMPGAGQGDEGDQHDQRREPEAVEEEPEQPEGEGRPGEAVRHEHAPGRGRRLARPAPRAAGGACSCASASWTPAERSGRPMGRPVRTTTVYSEPFVEGTRPLLARIDRPPPAARRGPGP